MRRRIQKLRYQLWRTGGVDIVVTHAPIEGVGDGQDIAHKGFAAFREFLEKYNPAYWLHGHMHLNYGQDKTRERTLGETKVINACGYTVLEIPEKEHDPCHHNRLRWRNGKPRFSDDC
jgi:Icc-related predicted phosphoesterase